MDVDPVRRKNFENRRQFNYKRIRFKFEFYPVANGRFTQPTFLPSFVQFSFRHDGAFDYLDILIAAEAAASTRLGRLWCCTAEALHPSFIRDGVQCNYNARQRHPFNSIQFRSPSSPLFPLLLLFSSSIFSSHILNQTSEQSNLGDLDTHYGK